MQDLESDECQPGSVVLLHMVAHNPSGFDPSHEQWQAILEVVQRKRLLPLMDNAYQGFFRGLQEDAYAAHLFAAAGVEMLLACSFSKNFGLYGERVGCLHVLSANASAGPAILSNLTALTRTLHSNCPSYGARIVTTILGDADLKARWMQECAMMANRLNTMRAQMHALLLEHKTPGNYTSRGVVIITISFQSICLTYCLHFHLVCMSICVHAMSACMVAHLTGADELISIFHDTQATGIISLRRGECSPLQVSTQQSSRVCRASTTYTC